MRKIVSKVSPKQFREIIYRQIMKKNRTRELDTMPIPKISAKHISTKLVANRQELFKYLGKSRGRIGC